MWLLDVTNLKLDYVHNNSDKPYAILSHRWEGNEITFDDMRNGRGRDRPEWRKIEYCCQQVKLERRLNRVPGTEKLQHVWIDTCCINKSDSAELSEAINSMYRWYKESKICYAYLSDVTLTDSRSFLGSMWFSRGWTLQELLAPREVRFYDAKWNDIGTRSERCTVVSRITNIPKAALQGMDFVPSHFSIADRMSWASKRVTTRREDQAYSLLGIFEINMPMLYGEGSRAFRRLQEEILKVSPDRTIYAWDGVEDESLGVLARYPSSFNHGSKYFHPYRRVEMKKVTDHTGTATSNVGLSASMYMFPCSRNLYMAPLAFVFDSYEHYLVAEDERSDVIVNMLVERLPSGVFVRVSADKQFLFEVPADHTDGEVRRILFARTEHSGRETTEVYGGKEVGEGSNGFRILAIDPVATWNLQTRLHNPNLIVRKRSGTSHVDMISRAKVTDPSILANPDNQIGVAGIIRFATPGADTVLLHLGLDFDFNAFCLISIHKPPPEPIPSIESHLRNLSIRFQSKSAERLIPVLNNLGIKQLVARMQNDSKVRDGLAEQGVLLRSAGWDTDVHTIELLDFEKQVFVHMQSQPSHLPYNIEIWSNPYGSEVNEIEATEFDTWQAQELTVQVRDGTLAPFYAVDNWS